MKQSSYESYEVVIEQDSEGNYVMALTISTRENYWTTHAPLDSGTIEDARNEATGQVRKLISLLNGM